VLAYKLNGNGKPLPLGEADSRMSQFMKCSMALVDLFQRDYELSAIEIACMDNYLRLIELSYNSWKRRTDRMSRPQKAARKSDDRLDRLDHGRQD
jgi:hypothetical protein